MDKRTIRIFTVAMMAILLPGCGDDDGGAPPPPPTAMLVPLLSGAPQPGRNLAFGVSGNGQVVVGTSESSAGMQAFRWVTGSTPQALGFLPGYTEESDANATNSDGTVIVGESSAAKSSRAFIWTSQQGLKPLGDLPGSYTYSAATGVSANGSVVVGSASQPNDSGEPIPVAFVWTAQRGFVFLGDFIPIPGTTSSAFGVSANGEVVVGEARYDINDMNQPVQMAFRWTRDSGLFPLGWLYDAQPVSAAYAASSDGSVIGGLSVGTGMIPVDEPMRWTPVTSMVTLGRGLVGAVHASSADGTKMAGGASDPGTAFVWDTENGYRNLVGLLEESGLYNGLQGHSPIVVSGMSADGTIVVGPALGEGIVRGFFVRLP